MAATMRAFSCDRRLINIKDIWHLVRTHQECLLSVRKRVRGFINKEQSQRSTRLNRRIGSRAAVSAGPRKTSCTAPASDAPAFELVDLATQSMKQRTRHTAYIATKVCNCGVQAAHPWNSVTRSCAGIASRAMGARRVLKLRDDNGSGRTALDAEGTAAP